MEAPGRRTSVDHCLDGNQGFSGFAEQSPATFSAALKRTFGGRFVCYLGLVYFGLKGIAFALLSSAMLPYFQQMQVTGNGFQLASIVASIPWSMKGFTGVLSDCVPVCGYHKRGYLVLASGIGLVAFACLTMLPLEHIDQSQVWPVAALFCCANILIATFDLLCEGKYSEMMRKERSGSEVLVLVWTCMQSGGLFAAVITKTVIDESGPQPLLGICVPLAVLALWRTWVGDLPEKPAARDGSLRVKVYSEPWLFALAMAMAAGGLLTAVGVTFLETNARCVLACSVSVGLVFLSFKALPSTLARSNLYMFLASAAYMDVSGPLSYFYIGTSACVVDSPHFSYSYYLAISNIVGSIGCILGAVAFKYMQHWTFQGAFCITALIQIVASGFDLMIVWRWNDAMGVSDAATYLFGDAACQSMASMLATMPMAMLTARLCPRGAEATVFAILAGFQNFGSTVGSILGVHLADLLDVHASAMGPCRFTSLGTLIIISHCIGPLLVLPLCFCLVPKVRIDDDKAFEVALPLPSFCSPPPSSSSSTTSSQSSTSIACSLDAYCLMDDDNQVS